jgi:hypothetical protein
MNVLNKGRCSRCIASKKDHEEIKRDTIKGAIEVIIYRVNWLKCTVTNKWCRYCAGSCKEPPMGISAKDYLQLHSKTEKSE